MSEMAVVDKWIVDTLSGNLTGIGNRIYGEVVPNDATYPLVLFQQLPSSDVMGVGPTRIMSRIDMSIRVVTKSQTYTDIETPAEEMDILLHGKTGSNSFGFVLDCFRLYPLKYSEVFDAQTYLYLGGAYRIDAQKA